MSTLDDYKALMDAAGYNTTQLGTAADLMINDARRRLCREHRWSWLTDRDTATLATVAGSDTVSLAGLTTLAHVEAIRLVDSSGRKLVTAYMDPQAMLDTESFDDPWWNADGVDFYWTKLDGAIRFFPTPDATYTLQVDFITTLPELSGSTADTIPDALRDIVVWAALPFAAFRQRDAQSVNTAENAYAIRLRTAIMQDATPQRQTSRQVRSGYWGS